MEDLPDEILSHILSLLSPFPAAGVCRLWRGIFAEMSEKMYSHTKPIVGSALYGSRLCEYSDILRASAFVLIIASTYGGQKGPGATRAFGGFEPFGDRDAESSGDRDAEHAEIAGRAWALNGAAYMCASSGPLNACNVAMALGDHTLYPVSEETMKFWLRECLRVWEPPRLQSGAPAEAVLSLARVISTAQLERLICFMSGYDGHSLWDEHDTLVTELLLQLTSRPPPALPSVPAPARSWATIRARRELLGPSEAVLPFTNPAEVGASVARNPAEDNMWASYGWVGPSAPHENDFSVFTLAVAVRFGMHDLPYFATARELYERGEVGLLYNASLFLICQNGLKRTGMKHRSLIYYTNAAGEAVAPTGERLCDCISAKKQSTLEHIREITGYEDTESAVGLTSINCHHPCLIRVAPVYYVRKKELTISDNFEQFDGRLRVRTLVS